MSNMSLVRGAVILYEGLGTFAVGFEALNVADQGH